MLARTHELRTPLSILEGGGGIMDGSTPDSLISPQHGRGLPAERSGRLRLADPGRGAPSSAEMLKRFGRAGQEGIGDIAAEAEETEYFSYNG